MTHVLEGDDVGVLSVSQQDLHLLRRVSLGFVDDLQKRKGRHQRRCKAAGGHHRASPCLVSYLDCVLHAGPFAYAALADGVGADADVLLDLVGV